MYLDLRSNVDLLAGIGLDQDFTGWDETVLASSSSGALIFRDQSNELHYSFFNFSSLTVTQTGAEAVPIPAALWLIMSGLAGLGFMRRKRAA